MPTVLRDLLAPPKGSDVQSQETSLCGFLVKVKGLQSLNIELSWRYVILHSFLILNETVIIFVIKAIQFWHVYSDGRGSCRCRNRYSVGSR